MKCVPSAIQNKQNKYDKHSVILQHELNKKTQLRPNVEQHYQKSKELAVKTLETKIVNYPNKARVCFSIRQINLYK